MAGVASRVVDQMVAYQLVEPDCKGFVMRSLLLRHKHVTDTNERNWWFPLKRNNAAAGSMASLQVITYEMQRYL